MRRVVSLFLPRWSTDRLRRMRAPSPASTAEPAHPLATTLADHGRKLLVSLDAAALGAGLWPGMTLAKARAMVPDLVAVDADPHGDAEALRRLATWAGRYSPIVAADPPDGLWLDISGCADLFGGERALLKDLHRRIAAAGLSVQLAVSDTPGCSHGVTRHVAAGRPVTIEPGGHRQAVALLPVAALRLDPDIVAGLHKLGFERVEQLIATPRGPLARRFGRGLYARLDQALGYAPEPIEPIVAPHAPRARRALLEPIATAAAIGQVIRDLTDDLVAQLGTIGRGARRLDLFCHRVDKQIQAVRIGTAAPSRDSHHLVKLLAARIEQIDPGLGIEVIELVGVLTEPLGAAQASLAPAERRGPDLAALVDALANRFGHGRLYRATPRAGTMPERSVAAVAALGAAAGGRWADDLPRPARLIEPPQPVQVTAMLPDHPPAMFIWGRARHRVVRADGPERLHGEWWRDAGHESALPYAVRDYFQVEVEGGGRYWLFRLGDGENEATGPMRWFIHGAFL
jgi:protein ImuB